LQKQLEEIILNHSNHATNTIAARLQTVRTTINQAESKYQRQLPNGVRLIAVSKKRSIDEINEAIAASQLAFGENYVQEALPKIEAITNTNVEWHYIGRMQTNKAKYLARHFHWVQSVTTVEHAINLSKYRTSAQPHLNICIEINLSNEENKTGITLETNSELVAVARAIIALPHLKLRGLMAIPAPAPNFEQQFATFQKLTMLYQRLQQQLNEQPNTDVQLDTLSMGMSDDFEAAIAAGTTMVRIGTAIFGPRH